MVESVSFVTSSPCMVPTINRKDVVGGSKASRHYQNVRITIINLNAFPKNINFYLFMIEIAISN